ncbi:hypothetical protein N657DRAFT_566061 [Parathielavia appendiculata]|uniref:Zn(2)-C6 fungal-type domain-containing protein n=1 Tax=Parathielavia appendiculata TaxID=2587402 RepID=A0AAN6U9C5_9PEZI|nr:hypothetical protein N657DRAFT_566061 [Parathielavia appendiculata]
MPDTGLSHFTTVFRATEPCKVKRKRPPVSCINCQKRKSRCDRRQPCGACEKRGEDRACRFGPASIVSATALVRELAEQNMNDRRGASHEGTEHSDDDRLSYRGPTTWSAVVESIHDIQNSLQAEEEESTISGAMYDLDLGCGDLLPVTTDQVLWTLPKRQDVDKLITAYFNAKSVAVPFLHVNQFRRRYDKFWESPATTSMLWISILFSILSCGVAIAGIKGISLSSSLGACDSKAYMAMAARCLHSGHYLKQRAMSVEAVVMYAHSRNMQNPDGDPSLWILLGLAVRLAQRQGYHRDTTKISLNITPFEAEMRRRVWFVIESYDALFSYQHGMPSIIHDDSCDAGQPTNMADDDFDEDSVTLTPRPHTDPLPILAYITKSTLLPLFRRIMKHALGVKPESLSSVAVLGEQLDKWYEAIPRCLKYRPIRHTSFTDANYTIFHRSMLELTYHMSRCALYRSCLVGGGGSNMRSLAFSVCRDSSLKMLDMHIEMDREVQPGGRLHEDRFMGESSLTLHSFLVAAMIICLELNDCQDMRPQDRAHRINLLRTSQQMWAARSTTSSDASRANRVLKTMLKKVESPYSSQSDSQTLSASAAETITSEKPPQPPEENAQHPANIVGCIIMTSTSIPETSTSLVLEAFNQPLSLKSTPINTPTPAGAALVRILCATIRPHNRAGFRGKQVLPFPVPYTPGNSAVARVLDVGADAVSLKPGQLVWVDGFVVARDDPVGTQMLLGLSDLAAEKPRKLFKAWPGVWADVAQVPLENCVPLDEAVLCDQKGYSFGDLEYIERLAVANAGIRAAHLRPGQTVVVCPATGHFSGAVAELAAQLGCRVIALTRSAAKLEPLTRRHPRILPVELTGDVARDAAAIRALCPRHTGAADALIDISPRAASANPTHLHAGLASLRNYGQAVFLGALGDVAIPYISLMLRNINIKGQWMYSRDQLADVIRLIESGVVRLGKEAGHEVVQGGFELADWEKAVEIAEEATSWGQQTLFLP